MSNSKLVDYTKISPHRDKRTNTIKKITIHHMAGKLSVEQCGEVFQKREASTNYGIGTDGRVGMYVEEKDRAWATANPENDHQAINIELANDSLAPDWHVSDKVIAKCILLCADICKRNGIEKLNYTGDKSGNLTMHKWFMATACPGPYLEKKFKYIADEVNKLLKDGLPIDGATTDEKPSETAQNESQVYPKLPSRGYYQQGDGYNKYTNLKNQIKLIQEYLNKVIGTNLDVDGEYGPKTTEAVKEFQKKAGITADGKYGKDTLAAAKSYKLTSTSTPIAPTPTNGVTEPAKSFDKKCAKTYIVNSKNGLNIRAGAGVDKKILVAVPYDHKLECYGYYTDRDGLRWFYIATEYNGIKYTGFISSVWVK